MTVSPGFDNRIGLLASRQASAFSREQVLAAGATDPMIARRLRSGRWTRAHPGVYVLTGSSPSWIQDVWCTWLAVGPRATVTHESVLRLHGVERARPRPITLTVPHGAMPGSPAPSSIRSTTWHPCAPAP
jgi:predicted transcriptional regulator of viral defense system